MTKRPIQPKSTDRRGMPISQFVRESSNANDHESNSDLNARIDELERRIQHLEKVIQRQIRLGRMMG